MLYCLKCWKHTESKNPKFAKTKTEEEYFYQNVQCVIVKKSKFIKEQEASGILSSLGIKTPLSKIPLLVLLLF